MSAKKSGWLPGWAQKIGKVLHGASPSPVVAFGPAEVICPEDLMEESGEGSVARGEQGAAGSGAPHEVNRCEACGSAVLERLGKWRCVGCGRVMKGDEES